MLIHLTRAPAAPVMHAAGVAAAAAERWDVVGRLLTEPRTETHTGGELLPVPLALPPDEVGLPGGAEQINRILWPLCVEHLGLDTASFVDGWERFEYLHHLLWVDACLREVKSVFGGSLGWAPFLRSEGLGASENRASVDLWFEDSAGNLVTSSRPEGLVTYDYDSVSQLIGFTDQTGTTTFDIDAGGRITSVDTRLRVGSPGG
jgi:YD repeat-containing protein